MKKLYFTASLLFAALSNYAQTSAPAAGGEGSGRGGSASYTVGETAYQTDDGNGWSAAQGPQQAYEVSELVERSQTVMPELRMQLYPNPTSDIVNISVQNYEKGDLSYQLFTSDGKLIEAGSLPDNDATIKMAGYAAGTYLIRISANKQHIKTFKLIKNQ